MTRLLVVLCLLGLAPALLAADSSLTYTPPAPPPAFDPSGLVLRLVGMTAVVLVVCGGILWLTRSAMKLAGPPIDKTGRLRHDGSVVLGRNAAVHLLRVDGQAIAVATDATGLKSVLVLSELPDHKPFDAVLDESLALPASKASGEA